MDWGDLFSGWVVVSEFAHLEVDLCWEVGHGAGVECCRQHLDNGKFISIKQRINTVFDIIAFFTVSR